MPPSKRGGSPAGIIQGSSGPPAGSRLFPSGCSRPIVVAIENGGTAGGGGDVDLAVGSRSYDYVQSGLGVKLARDLYYDTASYVPDVYAKWLQEFENPILTQNAAFAITGSPSFTTPGLKTANDMFNIGVGIAILSCGRTERTWSPEAVYDYYWRSDNYSANQGMFRLSTRF